MDPSNPEFDLEYANRFEVTKSDILAEIVNYVSTERREPGLPDYLKDMDKKPNVCYMNEIKAAAKLKWAMIPSSTDPSKPPKPVLNLTAYQKWAEQAFFNGMFNYRIGGIGMTDRFHEDFYKWSSKYKRIIQRRLFLDLLKKDKENWMKRVLAFAMGLHKRLGKKSLVSLLNHDILKRIAMFV